MMRHSNGSTWLGTGHAYRHMRTLIVVLMAIMWSLLLVGTAAAQSTAGVSYRYDGTGLRVGEISSDPDGAGGNAFAAVRTVYDVKGLVVRIESGWLATFQGNNIAPDNWTGFTILSTEHRQYDTLGRLVRTWVVGDDSQTESVVETNYDREGRGVCTAVRMNSSYWTTPRNACFLSTTSQGAYGVDRITRNVYDQDGRLRQIRRGVGTGDTEIADVTYDYSDNGQVTTIVDANGNRALQIYDGHDRLERWIFPSQNGPANFNPSTYTNALNSAGTANYGDDELYTYDANGNRLTLTKRDGTQINFAYDELNQLRSKTFPSPRAGLAAEHQRSVYYSYDLRGLQTAVRFDNAITGPGILNSYDGFGRLESAQNTLLTGSPVLQYEYDLNGNRTEITHPDGPTFVYDFDGLDRMEAISKGTTALVQTDYNNRGALSAVDRHHNAFDQSYGYDNIGRLTALTHADSSNPNNVAWTFAHNPSSQIVTQTRDNDAYAWAPGPEDQNFIEDYTSNGLNQYSNVAGADFCYDANGNLTSDGVTNVFLYDNENRLVERRALGATNCATNTVDYSGTLLAKLNYDPLGRLYRIQDDGGSANYFLNDGDALVLEYNAAGAIQDRYVHGNSAGADDPLVWFTGSSVANSNIRNLYSDTRGSIVLVADRNSGVVHQNSYSAYGQQGLTNGGRFQYTGQVYLEELGMYYYKARIYAPEIGRFMQTDPIGYEDQVNLYAYVGNDPINGVDPSGMDGVLVEFYDQPIAIPEDYGGGVFPQWISGGHSGQIIANEATGHTEYREYGRYEGAGEVDGAVRRQTIPDLVYDENSVPTEASLTRLLARLSEIGSANGSPDYELTFDLAADNLDAMRAEANRWDTDVGYSVTTGKTCHGFARAVTLAGRSERIYQRGRRFGVSVSNDNIAGAVSQIRQLYR